jgi:proprotein convertase subtilisin/kexin type 5
MSCNATNSCFSCSQQYKLVSGNCVLCGITNCLACADTTAVICLQCRPTTVLTSSKNACTLCSYPCVTCEVLSTNCTSCEVGYYLNAIDGTCLQCVGCSLCHPTVGTCMGCPTGQYLNNSNICTLCLNISSHCAICEVLQCLAC